MDIEAEVARFRALKRKEMQSLMKEKNKTIAAYKNKMRTSGNVGVLVVEYQKYLEWLEAGDDEDAGESSKTASRTTRRQPATAHEGSDEADEEAGIETQTNMLGQIFIEAERSISNTTHQCLEILGMPGIDSYLHKTEENDISYSMGPALEYVKEWGRAYSTVSASLSHNYAANLETLRVLIVKSLPIVDGAYVYKPFFKAMGVGFNETVVLSEELSNAVGVELHVIWTAINYTLETWKMSFPAPPADQLTWPVDFSVKEKKVIRAYIRAYLKDKPSLYNKTAKREDIQAAVSEIRDGWPVAVGKTTAVVQLAYLDAVSSENSYASRSRSRSNAGSETSEAPSSHPSVSGEDPVQAEDDVQEDAGARAVEGSKAAGKRPRRTVDSDGSDEEGEEGGHVHVAKTRRTMRGRGRGQERGRGRVGHAATAASGSGARSRHASPSKIGALTDLAAVVEEHEDEDEDEEMLM